MSIFFIIDGFSNSCISSDKGETKANMVKALAIGQGRKDVKQSRIRSQRTKKSGFEYRHCGGK